MRLDQAITQNAADPGAVMCIPTAEAEQLMPGEIVSASTDAPQCSRHPLSAFFPDLTAAELQDLKRDVAKHGLHNPIILHEGQVLDGWHRHLACQASGTPARYTNFVGDSPVAFVISMNVHRRNLDAGQRALAVAAVNGWSPTGRPVKAAPGAAFTKTTAQMAEEAGTGKRTMAQAKFILKEGSEEQKAAASTGTASLKSTVAAIKGPKSISSQYQKRLHTPVEEPKYVADMRAEGEEKSRVITDLKTQFASAKSAMESMARVLEADDRLRVAMSELDSKITENGLLKSQLASTTKGREELRRALETMTKERDTAVAAHQGCLPTEGVLQ